MRIIFKATIRGIPVASIASLLHSFPRVMYAMNVAKITNPMRLYTPEQATSMLKFIIVWSGLVIVIIGLAY